MRYVFCKEKDGQKVFYTNVWDPHLKKKIKKRVGTSRREAEEVAERLHAQIRDRGIGIRHKAKAPLLDEFIPRVISENYEGMVSAKSAARSLRRFREFAGNIPLTAVTRGLVFDFISWRLKQFVPTPHQGKSKASPTAKNWTPKKKVKNGTVNRDVETVKRMMSFAHEHEVMEWNPLAGMKKLSTKDSIRKPLLSPQELQSLLDAAEHSKNWRFPPAAVLALYTGRRKSDLLKRRVTDYKQSQGLLFLGKTKKGEAEWIRLPGAARQALDALYTDAVNGWLFPNASGTGPILDMDTAWREAKKRAGLDPKMRWHDLRHIAISYYVMAGVDYNTIAALVGHTTPTMIEQRYGHLSQRHKEATAVIFGGYMDRITGLGSVPGAATAGDDARSVSAQVADLISGEAAKALVVRKLLPGDTGALSTPAENPTSSEN